VVWASGLGGTYTVTTDGGNTWHAGVVPGAETLQFRDVQGVSDKIAYLMASGTGTDSRIYKTEDGGATWTLQFESQIADAFYDCFAFWNPTNGIAFSDSVNGVFPALRTVDGMTWQSIANNMPPALPGEGGFAASGTCVATQGTSNAWIATGAAAQARILATTDGGNTWAAYDTPIIHGTSTSGNITVDFRDALHGMVGGGELTTPNTFGDTVARSSDGGQTWQLTTRPTFPGAVYGLSYAHGTTDNRPRTVVATGPSGSAWTDDEGDTWNRLPSPGIGGPSYWAVGFANPQAGWMVGTQGRILKISFR
jgi:photosystem II stability/assembly factor-like uncharacterized protein